MRFTNLLCCTILALGVISPAFADPAAAPAGTNPGNANASGTGTEGANADEIVVTAERNTAAVDAPSKASVYETQPESLITHKYIEQSTPETGDYTTAVAIAPSVNSYNALGGGVGDVNSANMRGFQDGQFNVTFDGIAFGDANDTTHHPAAFFPGSTIGTAVVDRGPGAAGDMGQANFGGALHFFSPHVDDKFSVSQKVTYGSFNTQSYVTTLQTGAIDALGGAKLLLSYDNHASDGQLNNMGGIGSNFMAKLVVPLGNDLIVTGFSSISHIRYNQPDNTSGTILGFGITAAQQAAYGINFGLTTNPADEQYIGYNTVHKNTNFNYVDLRWNPGRGLSIENQAYYYFYDNQTISAQNTGDLLNPPTTGPNAGTSFYINAAGVTTTDIAGYHKQNKYDTYGDILRINQDFGFGTLRAGGLYEHSNATRFITNYDLTTGQPDTTGNYGTAVGSNIEYYEPSSWNQFQLFADFEWRPLENLTITPGIKQLHYTRNIDATVEANANGFVPVVGSRIYNKTMWFVTANYRIIPNWSVYAQAATGFLIPPVKTLTPANGTTASTQPQTTTTYQVGSVFTRGRLTLDGDYYYINANNVLIADKNGGCFCFLNTGKGRYFGVEAQGAFNIGYGFTAFANGSRNIARELDAGMDYTNAPRSTAAFGLIYDYRRWQASVSDKIIGAQLSSAGTRLSPYASVDASLSYDLGHVKLKIAGFNLGNGRSLLDNDGNFTVYQVGRQVLGTVQAKF